MAERGYYEIEAAYRAGFTRVEHFQRARKAGLFPPPAQEIPGQGPIWSDDQIARWLGIANRARSQREIAAARLDAEAQG